MTIIQNSNWLRFDSNLLRLLLFLPLYFSLCCSFLDLLLFSFLCSVFGTIIHTLSLLVSCCFILVTILYTCHFLVLLWCLLLSWKNSTFFYLHTFYFSPFLCMLFSDIFLQHITMGSAIRFCFLHLLFVFTFHLLLFFFFFLFGCIYLFNLIIF